MIIYKSDKRARQNQVEAYTVGSSADQDEEQDNSPHKTEPEYAYSEELKALIKECLLIEPERRPTPEWLVERTRQGLHDIRMASGNLPAFMPLPAPAQTLYPDPNISTGWYDGQVFATPAQAKLQQPQVPAPIVQPPDPAALAAASPTSQPIIPESQLRQNAGLTAALLQTPAQARTPGPPPQAPDQAPPRQLTPAFKPRATRVQAQVAPRPRLVLPPPARPALPGKPQQGQVFQPVNDPIAFSTAIIRNLSITVWEEGARNSRMMTFPALNPRYTFSRLKTLLEEHGCLIPPN